MNTDEKSLYNPSSTNYLKKWKLNAERKDFLSEYRYATVIKNANLVYSGDGYPLSDEFCKQLLNTTVVLFRYDIPTHYYQTTDYLWIHEDCLQFDPVTKSSDSNDEQFYIPITLSPVLCEDRDQRRDALIIPIRQSIITLYSAYKMFLSNIYLAFQINMVEASEYASESFSLNEYASGMDDFIIDTYKSIIQCEDPNDWLSRTLSYVKYRDDPERLFDKGCIKADCIFSPFSRWIKFFTGTTDIVYRYSERYGQLWMIFRTVSAEEIYLKCVNEVISSLLNEILSFPFNDHSEELKRIHRIRLIMRRGIKNLETIYSETYLLH